MGGGRDKFLPKNGSSLHGKGSRLDKDLIDEWKKDKKNRNCTSSYITTAAELQKLDIQNTDYLLGTTSPPPLSTRSPKTSLIPYFLGLFANSHLAYHVERPEDQPTLSQMTETAVKLLQKEKNGFFLFVEGGLIDKAHHLDLPRKALDETVEFANAIEIATKLTSENDTLIVVTADHSHTMTFNGYPARGHDILGIYGKSQNGLPYATLSYANGLGYRPESAPGQPHNMEHDDLRELSIPYLYFFS